MACGEVGEGLEGLWGGRGRGGGPVRRTRKAWRVCEEVRKGVKGP